MTPLTTSLDLFDRLDNYARRVVRPIMSRCIIDQAYAENQILAFSNVIIEVVDLWRSGSGERVRNEISNTFEVCCGVYLQEISLAVLG